MPTLIALLSSGKGTWTEVIKIMHAQPWSNIYLLTNQFGKENFTARQENVELIALDFNTEVSQLTKEMVKNLKGKIADFEVALNFASGSGKEHMAFLEAVLELGLNFRIVTLDKNQYHVLGLSRST